MIDFDIRGMGLVLEFSSADKVEPNEAVMQCGCVQTCGIPYTPKWPIRAIYHVFRQRSIVKKKTWMTNSKARTHGPITLLSSKRKKCILYINHCQICRALFYFQEHSLFGGYVLFSWGLARMNTTLSNFTLHAMLVCRVLLWCCFMSWLNLLCSQWQSWLG